MHVLHWIAVEADNEEEAVSKVDSQLLDWEGSWWDYFNNDVGGRWAGNEWCKIYKGKDISIGLDHVKANRKSEVERAMEKIDLSELTSLTIGYEGDDVVTGDYSLNLWRIKKLAEMLAGNWNCDSYFYDLEYGDAIMTELLKRLELNPDKQWLIPIDFHY